MSYITAEAQRFVPGMVPSVGDDLGNTTDFGREGLGHRAPRAKVGTIPLRRLFGVYYTPDDVAELLAKWALGASRGGVLDPSFGGCAFMHAAAKVLKANGCERPGESVFGVDIDPACIRYVNQSSELLESNFIFSDFLALKPGDIKSFPFQAIVGNPPYVRHHWLKDERRKVARRIAEESGQCLSEKASLWAYFVLHAFAFLSHGGRMAMLVPEAILQAEYAKAVRDALKQNFSYVRLIHVRQRLFTGTDEPVVVIAAEGFGAAGDLSVYSVETAGELEALLNGLGRAHHEETLPNGRRIKTEALMALTRIQNSPDIVCFGEVASTRIGIVTGANGHFIRRVDDLRSAGMPARAWVPIVSRTSWLNGLDFTEDDHRAMAGSGARAFLVRPTRSLDSEPGVVRWIMEGQQAGVHQHFKCAKRDPWYRVELSPRPDAFVTSTRLGPPRLVLNRGNVQCTNALYSANWKAEMAAMPEVIALGFLTTFVALWSEINGRRYGGGVLKLDLTALGKLPLPIVPEAAAIFQQVNAALRQGDEAGARAMADEAILYRGLGASLSDIDLMREALVELTRQRIPNGEDS